MTGALLGSSASALWAKLVGIYHVAEMSSTTVFARLEVAINYLNDRLEVLHWF